MTVNDLVRATALHGFVRLVHALGGDPGTLLTDAHLHQELLTDPDAYLPFRSVARLLERAAHDLDCPDFGLQLANRQSIEILGPIALIARHSATTSGALQSIAENIHIYSPALRIGLERLSETTARYTFAILATGLPIRTQMNELGIGVSAGVFRLLTGSQFRPLRVFLPHAAAAAPETYRRFFGCAVIFDADHCGFDVRTEDLDRPRAEDDPQVREIVAQYLDEHRADHPDAGLVTHVRHLIGRTLPAGQATVVNISAHLGVHPRSLQRWLARSDNTFERLLDDVRREEAERYLMTSSLTLGQIARMLGYSEQSCFSRAALRWFGEPARVYRRRVRTVDFTVFPELTH
jgi:AraC-like DNA-binding protein